MSQNGKATTIKKTFSRTTSISEDINTEASKIWSLLTNAADYPKWNSTIISIDGKIEKGETIKLKSSLDPSRTFKLKIKDFIPNQKLVWGDFLGTRTYTLQEQKNKTVFTMHEKIGGLMFPLFASKIPSFDEAFEQFTRDLKNEVE